MGKRHQELVGFGWSSDWIETFSRVALTGVSTNFCFYSDICSRHFETLAFRPAENQVAVLVTDITERKRAEEARRKRAEESLRMSEEEFRSLAESMPQIVWATRPDGWNIYFNQQWVDYTGMTMEESYGHGWNTPFHPDDKQRAWEAWQRAIQHRAP